MNERMQLFDGMADLASKVLRMNCKFVPLRGGDFDRADFILGNGLARWKEKGLNAMYYTVMDGHQTLAFGVGRTKKEAISMARRHLALLSPYELVEGMRKRREKLEADRAAAQIEWRKSQAKPYKPAVRKLPKRRVEIFEKSGGQCHYCGCGLELLGRWHIEHKMPRALLGTNDTGNLVASCAPCNHKKRDRTDLEFMAEIGKAANA